MMDMSHAESAFLGGRASFEKWKSQFDAQWNMPIERAMIGRILQKLPDDVRRRAPTETAILEQLYKHIHGG